MGPWRFDNMARGERNEEGQYSKSILARFVSQHVTALGAKEFGSKLMKPTSRNDLMSIHFGEEILQSNKAMLRGKAVGKGDVCLGLQPCIIKKCLYGTGSQSICFLVDQICLQDDKIFFTTWRKTTTDVVIAEHQIGPSPCCWTWDEQKLICIA